LGGLAFPQLPPSPEPSARPAPEPSARPPEPPPSMSHLSILPTALREADLLVSALETLQLQPQRQGWVVGFPGDEQPVDVHIRLEGGLSLGWRQQPDGSLALVGDVQRLSQWGRFPGLLTEITRAYAAHLALREASAFPYATTTASDLVH